MFNVGLSVFGIVLSVFFFVIAYRQTVGAKKERSSACNSDVQKILLRRVVLEEYAPTPTDVGRILDGKARDFRVKSADLLSEAQVLNGLYTSVVENDLIPPQQRHEALQRILPALIESEDKPIEEIEVTPTERKGLFSKSATVITVIAFLASISGAIISTLPSLVNFDTTFPTVFRTLAYTAGASLAIISLGIAVFRLRSSQEEMPTKGTEVDHYVRFEHEAFSALKRLGFRVRPAPANVGVDFVAEKNGQRFVIEVKAWSRPVPKRVVSEVIMRMKQTATKMGNTKAMIITKVPVVDAGDLVQDSNVEILTLNQLRGYRSDTA